MISSQRPLSDLEKLPGSVEGALQVAGQPGHHSQHIDRIDESRIVERELTSPDLGRYEDSENHIGLVMDEFANEWRLVQKVGGVEVQSLTYSGETILPSTLYRVDLTFDGEELVVAVDGDTIFVMSPWQGAAPAGTVGFRAAETIAIIDSVLVITVTEAGGSPVIFSDSFESGGTTGWSVVVP